MVFWFHSLHSFVFIICNKISLAEKKQQMIKIIQAFLFIEPLFEIIHSAGFGCTFFEHLYTSTFRLDFSTCEEIKSDKDKRIHGIFLLYVSVELAVKVK